MELFPTIIMIFAGAGDLTWRRLVPSLFAQHREGRMPKEFAILTVDRVAFRDKDLHHRFLEGVKRFSRDKKVKAADWHEFARHITYLQGDFQDPVTYSNLGKRCAQLDAKWKVKAGHIFHLATPPAMVRVIPKLLANAGLNGVSGKVSGNKDAVATG